jgi:hypothetical protein
MVLVPSEEIYKVGDRRPSLRDDLGHHIDVNPRLVIGNDLIEPGVDLCAPPWIKFRSWTKRTRSPLSRLRSLGCRQI